MTYCIKSLQIFWVSLYEWVSNGNILYNGSLKIVLILIKLAITVQIVANTDLIPNNLNFHSCVTIDGTLVPSSHPKQEVELQADKVTLINNCNENYPFQPRSFAHSKFVRNHPGCKAKTNSVSSLLRIRNVASQAVHQFFQSEEFLQVRRDFISELCRKIYFGFTGCFRKIVPSLMRNPY